MLALHDVVIKIDYGIANLLIQFFFQICWSTLTRLEKDFVLSEIVLTYPKEIADILL